MAKETGSIDLLVNRHCHTQKSPQFRWKRIPKKITGESFKLQQAIECESCKMIEWVDVPFVDENENPLS